LKVRGESEAQQRERTLDALTMVGLREWVDHYPHNLSGGMQQRIGLARALATDADVLLMDEAFSALDPLIRREMQDELVKLQERLQKTILFITHDLGEALRVGDRIAIMRAGYVVQIGTPQDIITSPADDYVAEFIADVDSGRVLTAEFIMSPAEPLKLKKHDIKDVLARMDQRQTNAIYVANDKRGVEGIVRRHRLQKMLNDGNDDFESAIRGDFPRAAQHAHLNELYKLSAKGDPIAIIDEKGELEGIVYPLHIFEALAQHGYNDIEDGETADETTHKNGAGDHSNGSKPENLKTELTSSN